MTRKPLPSDLPTNASLNPITEADSDKWPSHLATSKPSVFISALGTTRGAAGSFAAQRAIDIDLNVALAKAAKEAGARVYVLISSAGVSSSSMLPYSKMKGELEDKVLSLGFEKTVIVKPGLLVGDRQESRPPEAVLRWIAAGLGKINAKYLRDTWAQPVDIIGRATVKASLMSLEGNAPEGKVWYLEIKDIVRLGKTEWTD